MSVTLLHGDCLEMMRTLDDNSVDAVVTDPPYGLAFMGKAWDYDVPGVDVWREALRVLKPGGHLLSFFGSRTYHRGVCKIEDAGFEIRDCIMWIYGSGFPKSLDVSKAIDNAAFGSWLESNPIERAKYEEQMRQAGDDTKARGHVERKFRKAAGVEREKVPATGGLHKNANLNDDGWHKVGADAPVMDGPAPATHAARQWQGWGTALKPAHEPIVVARKPLEGTVAANVLKWGCGGVNVDGGRVGTTKRVPGGKPSSVSSDRTYRGGWGERDESSTGYNPNIGRFPANVIHDGSDEATLGMGDSARYFYSAKASKRDRDEGYEGLASRARPTMGNGIEGQPNQEIANARNHHPTVKPTDLMRYLCRLVTQPNGVILDPFMGSGSTGKAAVLEGFQFIGIEREAEYLEIAKARIEHAASHRQAELPI